MDKINSLLAQALIDPSKENKAALKIYKAIENFNRFKICYNDRTTLCVGGKMLYGNKILIEQDVFKLYSPCILQDENDKFVVRKASWDSSDNLLRLERTDGSIMYIYCYNVQDKLRKRVRFDVESLADLAYTPLVDYVLSREIDGRKYYVLDLFRVRTPKKIKFCIEYLSEALESWKYSDKTLTVAFELIDKQGRTVPDNPTRIRYSLWDLVLNEPIGNNW